MEEKLVLAPCRSMLQGGYMHIMVLTDRFAPEVTAVSIRTLAHAQHWLRLGHTVTVVTCAPNFPRGILFSGYKNSLFQEDEVEGVPTIRLWSFMHKNEGVIRRTLDYASFTLSSVLQSRRLPDPDIILATSPPIFVPISGVLLSLFRRIPWVFELRDLWPASIRAVGASTSYGLKLVEKLELDLYRRAQRIISLTHAFKDVLTTRGIDYSKIDVVTNGVDTDKFYPESRDLSIRESLNIPRDAFLVGYIGTTGMAHGLSTLVNAASICKNTQRIHFLILGEGAERRSLQHLANTLSLSNITFSDFVPHNLVNKFIQTLDLAVIHLKKDALFETVIPSKIFEFMALQVPMIISVSGEARSIIENAGCGYYSPPENYEALADAVIALSAEPQKTAEMGLRGRAIVLRKYDRRKLAHDALDALERSIYEFKASKLRSRGRNSVEHS